MYEQQLDLFSSAGVQAEPLPLSIELSPADTDLDDQALIAAIPDSNLACGVQVARSLTYTLDNMRIAKMEYTEVVANPVFPAETSSSRQRSERRGSLRRLTKCPISGCCGVSTSTAFPTATRSISCPAAG